MVAYESGGSESFDCIQFNKLMSVFHASVLLFIMNFVITLSKPLNKNEAGVHLASHKPHCFSYVNHVVVMLFAKEKQ